MAFEFAKDAYTNGNRDVAYSRLKHVVAKDFVRAMPFLCELHLDRGEYSDAVQLAYRALGEGETRVLVRVDLHYMDLGLDDTELMTTGLTYLEHAAKAGDGHAKEMVRVATESGMLPAKGKATARPQKQAGGCYIATAVYGSYDAPPVMSLRRFRDERLAASAAGRVFIHFYYAVSPRLARHFAGATRVNGLARRILDQVVSSIERRG